MEILPRSAVNTGTVVTYALERGCEALLEEIDDEGYDNPLVEMFAEELARSESDRLVSDAHFRRAAAYLRHFLPRGSTGGLVPPATDEIRPYPAD